MIEKQQVVQLLALVQLLNPKCILKLPGPWRYKSFILLLHTESLSFCLKLNSMIKMQQKFAKVPFKLWKQFTAFCIPYNSTLIILSFHKLFIAKINLMTEKASKLFCAPKCSHLIIQFYTILYYLVFVKNLIKIYCNFKLICLAMDSCYYIIFELFFKIWKFCVHYRYNKGAF